LFFTHYLTIITSAFPTFNLVSRTTELQLRDGGLIDRIGSNLARLGSLHVCYFLQFEMPSIWKLLKKFLLAEFSAKGHYVELHIKVKTIHHRHHTIKSRSNISFAHHKRLQQ